MSDDQNTHLSPRLYFDLTEKRDQKWFFNIHTNFKQSFRKEQKIGRADKMVSSDTRGQQFKSRLQKLI